MRALLIILPLALILTIRLVAQESGQRQRPDSNQTIWTADQLRQLPADIKRDLKPIPMDDNPKRPKIPDNWGDYPWNPPANGQIGGLGGFGEGLGGGLAGFSGGMNGFGPGFAGINGFGGGFGGASGFGGSPSDQLNPIRRR